jgi:1-acyl-sn-glycerol-3-phosphate acyltransferase
LFDVVGLLLTIWRPMKFIKVTVGILWKAYFMLHFIASLIVLYPLFFILLLNKKWFPLAFKLKKIWTVWLVAVSGILPSVKYRVPKNKLPQTAVYCANHMSYLDIVMAYVVIPNYFVSMAKKELGQAPLFNVFFKRMNILVDRKSVTAAHKAFVRAGKEIDKGNGVFLFPEGGIITNDGKLHKFKNGAFKLAIDKQVPVVPITFLNNWKLFQNGVLFRTQGRPGISKIIVHKPISTKGMTANDLVSLRTRVHDIIHHDLEQYNSQYKKL